MRLSTKITRIQLASKIIDITIAFAKRYNNNSAEDVKENFKEFSDKLNILLKIK